MNDDQECRKTDSPDPVGRTRALISDHRVLAAFWTTWTLGIITFAVVRVFDDPGSINVQTVAALTAVLGSPALFIKLLQWIRPKQGPK